MDGGAEAGKSKTSWSIRKGEISRLWQQKACRKREKLFQHIAFKNTVFLSNFRICLWTVHRHLSASSAFFMNLGNLVTCYKGLVKFWPLSPLPFSSPKWCPSIPFTQIAFFTFFYLSPLNIHPYWLSFHVIDRVFGFFGFWGCFPVLSKAESHIKMMIMAAIYWLLTLCEVPCWAFYFHYFI